MPCNACECEYVPIPAADPTLRAPKLDCALPPALPCFAVLQALRNAARPLTGAWSRLFTTRRQVCDPCHY